MHRFRDGRTALQIDATVEFRGDFLYISRAGTNETLAAWPAGSIVQIEPPDPDNVVTYGRRSDLEVLLTDDPATIATLGQYFKPEAKWTRRRWSGLAAGFVATFALLALIFDRLPGVVAMAMPIGWEQAMGRAYMRLTDGMGKRCESAEAQAALDRFAERLQTAGDIRLPIKVGVVDAVVVNAFTLPGGNVLVMRGLLDRMKDGAELAGVLGHEFGHVAHRDSVALLVRQWSLSLIADTFGLNATGSTLATGAGVLVTLAYGRAAEEAADTASLSFLEKAGMRTDGLSRFFGDLESLEAKGPKSGGWLHSHPLTEERRQRTERPATGADPFTTEEWAAIKGMCAKNER